LHRNCHLKHVIEGKIEVVGRQGRRCAKVLDDLKKKRMLEIERGSTRSHCQTDITVVREDELKLN
jgi:hypothetical protein